ncbi:hypothetical protein JCM10207_004775 [Rhodosporidiobolus poonsookiae]
MSRHAQEPTDASIVSADGLASFQALRREEDEERSSRGRASAYGSARRHAGDHGEYYGAADPAHYPPLPPSTSSRSPPPASYGPHTSSTWTSLRRPSFPAAPAFPQPALHPSDSFVSLPSPSFASHPPPPSHDTSGSGSTPSYRAGLPAFSQWNPTWYSGSLSGDGRGVTYHAPGAHSAHGVPQAYPAPGGTCAHHDPFEDEGRYERGDLGGGWVADEEEDEYGLRDGGEGGKGEYHLPGGDYLTGVGYAAPSTKPRGRVDDRLRRLEAKFGSSSPADAAGGTSKGPPKNVKQAIRLARESRRRDKREAKERSGVDSKGRLVTVGKKKRVALRWAQGIGAVIVAVGSVGGALFTHPSTPPAQRGSLPLIALYVLPFLSLALTLYLHAIRPAIFGRRAASAAQAPHGAAGVFPLAMPGPPPKKGWGCCGGGRNRAPRGAQGRYQPPGGPTTVNLVVDPAFFPALTGHPSRNTDAEDRRRKAKERKRRRRRKRRREREEKAAGDDDGASLVSSSSLSSLSSLSSDDTDASDAWSATPPPSSRPQRKGILSHLALEAQWAAARAWAKRLAAADAAMGTVWAAVGVWAVGWAGRCEPGEGEGFCDLYNTALAFSILLALAFFFSLTLGCLDLSRAKLSPRMKQQGLRGVGGAV